MEQKYICVGCLSFVVNIVSLEQFFNKLCDYNITSFKHVSDGDTHIMVLTAYWDFNLSINSKF